MPTKRHRASASGQGAHGVVDKGEPEQTTFDKNGIPYAVDDLVGVLRLFLEGGLSTPPCGDILCDADIAVNPDLCVRDWKAAVPNWTPSPVATTVFAGHPLLGPPHCRTVQRMVR